MKDILEYLTDEGFVAIFYWYKEDGLIDGRISSLKEWEPIYLELEGGGTKLLWRDSEQVYTYSTTNQFFKKYGKLFNSANEAYLASNKWIREAKEMHMQYKDSDIFKTKK